MGTDVWSETGVVINLVEAYRAIPRRGYSATILAVQKCVKKKIKKISARKDKDDKAELDRLKCLANVAPNDLDGFLEALSEVSEYREDDEYEYDSSGAISEIWKTILKTSHPDLPLFGELKVFTNGRECGYDVPVGEPVLIFSQDKLIKRVPTEKGKKFKKVFGSCEENTWSVMSY